MKNIIRDRNKTDKVLKRAFCILLVFFVLLCTACGSGNQKTEIQESTDEALLEAVEAQANKSGSMWELMCRMFPSYIIHKDLKGNFTHTKVNTELALNTYDWSSLAGTYKGMDVSYYQGDINWSKVAQSGITYAIIRVGYRGYSEGKMVTDNNFEANIKGALENDIPVGVYLVTKALTEEEAVEEAEFLINHIKVYNVTWPVVIDIEPTANIQDRTAELTADVRTRNVLAFCNRIKEEGYTPMIYGGVGTFMNYLEFDKLEGIDKWFAQYFNQPYLRYEFGIWQASSTGSVSGIKGDVDINYSIKDYGKADK